MAGRVGRDRYSNAEEAHRQQAHEENRNRGAAHEEDQGHGQRREREDGGVSGEEYRAGTPLEDNNRRRREADYSDRRIIERDDGHIDNAVEEYGDRDSARGSDHPVTPFLYMMPKDG